MSFHRQTISVDEALNRLLAVVTPLPEEWVGIGEAYGRTLARELTATCDMPPFDRSALDGFAVRAADTAGATVENPVRLAVTETIAAGQVPGLEVKPGTACRIMTGAMMPPGADAVIMLEQTEKPGEVSDTVGVKRALKPGENISRRGEEMKSGERIVRAGERINAGTLALLATFGYAAVPVVRRPRVGLLATGSELLDVDQPLVPGKIRNSNSVMLSALIGEAGGIPVLFPRLPDDPAQAKRALAACTEQVDLLVTSGGVSVGDFDVIAALTDEPDVELLFNRVAMRPGSPTTAARYGSKLLCALSGNPAACFIGFELFVRPVLRRMTGQQQAGWRKLHARLAQAYDKPCPFPRFLRGRLEERDTVLYAHPDFNDKAGNLITLKESECFIIIPAGGKGRQAGEIVEVIPHAAASWTFPG
ncbi:molybdopterin molybdotransferase MoeA [Brevibacillus sp. SYP-B805]|uniref:molybdopterin molybdotransferase MoeA n=1 Tax=Brevibacillus sp. SYP-B805 TaxID=1578199 RepID=UPI0013EA0A8D|nr:gephyrin-like molybdotransferase Glp [Brevibacillus sp. SYP-B805]NGQ94979.1 molybdopterin molybdotransferase MoeA [Brevibacillus sp. SYP-B805]